MLFNRKNVAAKKHANISSTTSCQVFIFWIVLSVRRTRCLSVTIPTFIPYALLYHGDMNIYFSGLGGVGVGPLVEIALDAGYRVQGSDLADGLQTEELRQRGVTLEIGTQDGSFLRACHTDQPIDWFVYTSALPENHPELLLARELGIPTTKRAEFLTQFIKEKQLSLIAVSGTHGKTTTTGMLIWVFKQLGIPVSYSIGTTISFGPDGHYDPKSKYFIYEGDEFDRNMLNFHPTLSLLPSVDYDHPDTYPTQEDYTQAFRDFIAQSEHTILWQRDNTTLQASGDTVWSLGENELLDLTLPGIHTRRNATLVIKAIEYLGFDVSAAHEALERFPGTNRRFEKLADHLYSDYGHHPVEIAATLQMARELSPEVVVVYQPHQNRRQHDIQHEYRDQFALAEAVYWLPTYLSREDPTLPILEPETLVSGLTNRDVVHIADMNNELWQSIQTARQAGKLVLAFSAGSLDGWLRDQLAND